MTMDHRACLFRYYLIKSIVMLFPSLQAKVNSVEVAVALVVNIALFDLFKRHLPWIDIVTLMV